jgi:hypothetical protein
MLDVERVLLTSLLVWCVRPSSKLQHSMVMTDMVNGERWGHGRRRHHRNDFRAVIEAAGLDPDEVTLYALRHSSIVRQLLANVPIRIVATLHDTSVKMIERTYSRYIAGHSDEIARRALLETNAQPPAAANVVPLAKGR